MPAVLVESLSKSYGIKPLLDDVSFSLEDQARMGVIGANGSGKTTLLRMIAGTEKPDSGRIIVPSGARVGIPVAGTDVRSRTNGARRRVLGRRRGDEDRPRL